MSHSCLTPSCLPSVSVSSLFRPSISSCRQIQYFLLLKSNHKLTPFSHEGRQELQLLSLHTPFLYIYYFCINHSVNSFIQNVQFWNLFIILASASGLGHLGAFFLMPRVSRRASHGNHLPRLKVSYMYYARLKSTSVPNFIQIRAVEFPFKSKKRTSTLILGLLALAGYYWWY